MTRDHHTSRMVVCPAFSALQGTRVGVCLGQRQVRLGRANSEIGDLIRLSFTCSRTDTYRVQVKDTPALGFWLCHRLHPCSQGSERFIPLSSSQACGRHTDHVPACHHPCSAKVRIVRCRWPCSAFLFESDMDDCARIIMGAHPDSPGTTCSSGAPHYVVGPAPQHCMVCDPCACPGEKSSSASDPSGYVPMRPTWH